MKSILVTFSLLVLCLFFTRSARATDFVFSSFQCDPLSCEDTGLTATVSSASVGVNSTCTGGAVAGFNMTITVNVGIGAPCKVPYTPFAKAEKLSTALLDDCGDPYQVDTLRLWGEVFDESGAVVYSTHGDWSCDGGVSSPIVFGTLPC